MNYLSAMLIYGIDNLNLKIIKNRFCKEIVCIICTDLHIAKSLGKISHVLAV